MLVACGSRGIVGGEKSWGVVAAVERAVRGQFSELSIASTS